jgi:hypothetical protein
LAYELQVCQEMNDVCQNKFFWQTIVHYLFIHVP